MTILIHKETAQVVKIVDRPWNKLNFHSSFEICFELRCIIRSKLFFYMNMQILCSVIAQLC